MIYDEIKHYLNIDPIIFMLIYKSLIESTLNRHIAVFSAAGLFDPLGSKRRMPL